MLLILQITQLDYGDAALCALSALRGRAEDPGSAASRLLEALESVPPELIRRLLDAIPDRDKAAALPVKTRRGYGSSPAKRRIGRALRSP